MANYWARFRLCSRSRRPQCLLHRWALVLQPPLYAAGYEGVQKDSQRELLRLCQEVTRAGEEWVGYLSSKVVAMLQGKAEGSVRW